MQTNDATGIHIEGHIKIFDPVSKEIYINKRNAIHYENMSIALASSLANSTTGGFVSVSYTHLTLPTILRV